MYIEREYCTWSDRWFGVRTLVYLTCILKQNAVHGLTCDTVQNISMAQKYIEKIFYMELYLIEFQNISISHMCIETEYCTWSDMWYSFRTSVCLTCILKQNFYMECHMMQFQNISVPHMYIETDYFTWIHMWFSFRTSVYPTCILKQNIVHLFICDTVSEHQYVLHVYRNSLLYMEWHIKQFQNFNMSHMYIETE